MRLITKYYKRLRFTYIKTIWFALAVNALFLPYYTKLQSTGNNFFTVTVNGELVGTVDAEEKVDRFIRDARRSIVMSSNSSELVFMNADVEIVGEEVYIGMVDDEGTVRARIYDALKRTRQETMQRSYTVKVNETTVNLASTDEVYSLLDAALRKYDEENAYTLSLVLDPERELNVLTPVITSTAKQDETAGEEQEEEEFLTVAGVEWFLEEAMNREEEFEEQTFEDFDLGISGMTYNEDIEVVEAYLPQDELTDLDTAIALITENQEVQQIYTIQPGDTLSEISMKFDLPMEELIAMNPDTLRDQNSILHIDDELIITVPEPSLSVLWSEQRYYEEDYDADIIYIDNDSWYTTQQVTLQEPSQGHRKVVASISYKNTEELGREILMQEVTLEAVPKIVERGTIIPPSYIKPIYGGRLTSGFGGRTAPTKGASTNHKGVDWAVPIGTTVMASSSGTVARAGWASGYGYVVYINHPDGRQTRYGHCSRVIVSPGQYVVQGQAIAYSGNTGRSTGPHLHFEMLINGVQVDPRPYLD
ncbi:MAG: M23 family metallopeptidase [Lachnospiraceae bacterium]|nr:M23 family metallopeptidase [Lachnospiraceae bacterium]MBD5483343.1 M23 family metallopeptidase [Lachnospiraceae bacterium]